jgi:SAM-dependent methyltransferase
MSKAAEQFYTKSHNKYVARFGEQAHQPVESVLNDLRQGNSRYSCVFEFLKHNPGLSLLELGCGTGDIAVALASLVQNYTIVDILDRLAGTEVPSNLKFQKADLHNDFPFEDNSFECVIAMMVIEHLFDPFHSFREIARITRPNGVVFVNLPNIASFRCRIQLLMGRMPVTSAVDWFDREEWDGNHLHYFTVSDTLRLAEHCGLKPDGIFPVGNQLWLKRLAPSLFCHEISYRFRKPA